MANWRNLHSIWSLPESSYKRGAIFLYLTSTFLGGPFLNHPSKEFICWVVPVLAGILAFGLSDYLTRERRNVAAFALWISVGVAALLFVAWKSWPVPQESFAVFNEDEEADVFPFRISRDFVVGDDLCFNVFYEASKQNSNRITIVAPFVWVYIADSHDTATQERLIADFHRRILETKIPHPPFTLSPGETRMTTAYAWNDDRSIKKLTSTDLDDLHWGRKFVFRIVEIRYIDAGVEHHLRRFGWLQPPIHHPGIWHMGYDFASD